MSVLNADKSGMYSWGVVAAMEECIDSLQTTLTRYRRVIAYLRRENSNLRKLKNIQIQNDAAFKEMCQSDVLGFVTDVTEGEELFPDPQAS